MSIQGYGERTLAELVLQLVQRGMTFEARINDDGTWTVHLTGGY